MNPGKHNTPEANLAFQITWTETNLRYLLGEEPRQESLIAAVKAKIAELKALRESGEAVEI